eukprot:comp21389_c0_seq1/m.29439 comp21389_c0_seq1/g.29439  ORF comp21389_c0_seq1/g.29439 comp21389_c0_seq1/m.29439 type:complete len:776 (-) comp21389_c0_seq1:702-3029(-)
MEGKKSVSIDLSTAIPNNTFSDAELASEDATTTNMTGNSRFTTRLHNEEGMPRGSTTNYEATNQSTVKSLRQLRLGAIMEGRPVPTYGPRASTVSYLDGPRASTSAYFQPRPSAMLELDPVARASVMGRRSVVSDPVARASQLGTVILPAPEENWEFGEKGTTVRIPELPPYREQPREHRLLGQFVSTALSGNDITSSCLYVAGICAYYAGPLAPISLVIVAGILYMYRRIYAEVVGALPINGGTYTALLNTTSKPMAAVAGCLTIVSYVATAVVSGASASAYFVSLVPAAPLSAVFVAIIAIFGLLVLLGIGDSAPVALVIFLFHLLTLTMVIVDSIITASKDKFALLVTNWNTDLSTIPGANDYNVPAAIFFGACAGLLGVSGFETSANFVEDQKPGVFPKTLRNMWAIVSIANPLISLCGLATLPLARFMGLPLVDGAPDNSSMLSEMASSHWLKTLVNVDAVIVLSGAVLTGYVGVIGLIRRMALDRCLPSVFLSTNRLRGTNHWIILTYFLLCASLYFIMNGNILILGGVYTIAFLCVMTLFGVSNLLLKIRRSRIKRPDYAPVPLVLTAIGCLIAGLIGNVLSNQDAVPWFILYFSLAGFAVFCMFQRAPLFKALDRLLANVDDDKWTIFGRCPTRWFRNRIIRQTEVFKQRRMVFFIKNESIYSLNKAVQYVRENEKTSWLQIVHVYDEDQDADSMIGRLEEECHVLDRIYPEMRLDVVAVKGVFGRAVVDVLSEVLGVPRHFMFIACPGKTFPADIASLGGVRIVTL